MDLFIIKRFFFQQNPRPRSGDASPQFINKTKDTKKLEKPGNKISTPLQLADELKKVPYYPKL